MTEQMKQAMIYADEVVSDRDNEVWTHIVNAFNVGYKHGKDNTIHTNKQLVDALKFAYAKLGEAMEYDSVIVDRSDLDLVKTALRDAGEEDS